VRNVEDKDQVSSVKCDQETTRQTAVPRLETPSRCHSCPNPQFVSVLGYECLGDTENICRHGPSRVFPFLSLNMPRETCPATRSSSSPVLYRFESIWRGTRDHVKAAVSSPKPSQPSAIQVVAEHAYRLFAVRRLVKPPTPGV
jgi:hypothetical protein